MQVEWRRNKVFELLSKGNSQSEIAKVLQVDLSIISRDVYYLRQQAKSNIKRYIDETLPEEYEKCLIGVNSILREAFHIAHTTENKKEKIQALSLAKECYSMKLDLLTNAGVVDDAIRFVLDYNNNNKKLLSKAEEDSNKQQSKEEEQLDYNSEDTELEEEEQGEKAREITTTNQIF
jgi:hypothetical protein